MSRITAKQTLVVLLLAFANVVRADASPGADLDWNDEAIAWQDYADGLKLAHARGAPVLLVLYADWCPTCHAYSQLFADSAVVQASTGFVMIRVNADEAPELNARYAFDGLYLPRVFLLGVDGEVAHDLYPPDRNFRYFVETAHPERLVALMRGMRSREINATAAAR